MTDADGPSRYPLSWPAGWVRTSPERRKSSRYKVTEHEAMRSVLGQLRMMGGRGPLVSTNRRLRRDGLPYSGDREPEDPGVAVYWTDRRGQPRVMACDCWRTIRENYRAIALSLDSIRALERAGASQVIQRAYDGFKALPRAKSCWEVLELDPKLARHWSRQVATAEINTAHRRLARENHPDHGGSSAAMARINGARDEALRLVVEPRHTEGP